MKALCACVLVVVSLSSTAAQEKPSAATQKPKATIALGDATAPPDWELRVSVSLTLAEGTQVGRLTMRIAYPAQVLRYLNVEESHALKAAGLEIKVELPKPTAQAETASLQVEVRAAGKDAKTLPSGPLGNLVFKVADLDAHDPKTAGTKEAEKKVADKKTPDPATLRTWSVTAEDVRAWGPAPSPTGVEAGAERAAKITVAPAGLPIFACFFYMH